MARVLVTHAGSVVGHNVVRRLQQRGLYVRRAVWSGRGASPRAHSDVGMHLLDVDRLDSIDRALEGCDTLVLITPTSRDQAQLALPLIERARRGGIDHLVKLSTLGSQVEPGFEFGRQHRTLERSIYSTGIPYTIVRSASFLQNLRNRWRRFIAGNVLRLPLGGGVVNWIDVEDVADVLATIVGCNEHLGKEYDVTGGRTLSGDDLARIGSAMLVEEIAYRDESQEGVRAILTATGADAWYAESTLELFALTQRGLTAMLSATVEHLLERYPMGGVPSDQS